MDYKVLDLFCGGGGGAIGVRNSLLKLGIKPEFVGVENDPKIAYVYSQNVGKTIISDLRNLEAIPKVKMVIATPPCQQWSIARTKTTQRTDSEIGLLLPEIIERAKPKWFIMENVEGYKKSLSFSGIRNSLSKIGYQCNFAIFNCAGLIPQSRKRLFLWAVKGNLKPGNPLTSNSQIQSWGKCKQFRKELQKCPDSNVIPRQRKAIQEWLKLSCGRETELLIERSAMRSDRKPTIRNELLEQTVADIDNKIDGYIYIIKQKTAQKEFYAEESKRLAHKAQTVDNSIRFLKSKLHKVLTDRFLNELPTKIQGKYYKVSLAGNGGKRPLKYELDQLPEKFKVRREVVDVDQAKLTEALLENDGELTDEQGNVIAYLGERGLHVRIS